MNKYQYLDEKGEHLHQIFKDEEWKPLVGTSSVVSVLAKPLTWWASGMAVAELGWTKAKDEEGEWVKKEDRIKTASERLKELREMSDEDYLALLDSAYRAHDTRKNQAAKGGKDLHALAEAWVKGQIDGTNIPHDPLIQPLVTWSNQNVDKWLWSEINCYSEENWTGGISDAGFLDKDGKIGIMDFKSSKDAYTEQFIQCAGYDIALSENGGYRADGTKVFDLEGKKIDYYAILPFGMKNPEPKLKGNTEELKEAFKSALYLYKLLKI